jgi:uncharacterized membrane-anchored protein YhcB (DUF1043 family)
MTNSHIDIDKAIKLTNSRKTTIDSLCKFLYSDIKDYQEEREIYHLEQLKFEYEGSSENIDDEFASEQAAKIEQKIEKDVKTFSVNYAKSSIDIVLDAMNAKRFKTKIGPQNLLVLLTTLQEMNE